MDRPPPSIPGRSIDPPLPPPRRPPGRRPDALHPPRTSPSPIIVDVVHRRRRRGEEEEIPPGDDDDDESESECENYDRARQRRRRRRGRRRRRCRAIVVHPRSARACRYSDATTARASCGRTSPVVSRAVRRRPRGTCRRMPDGIIPPACRYRRRPSLG